MPNWIHNTLELVGPKAKIDEFYNTLQAQLAKQDPEWGLTIEWYDGFFELPQEMPRGYALMPVSPDYVNEKPQWPAWYNFNDNWKEYNCEFLGFKWSDSSLSQETKIEPPLAIDAQQSQFTFSFETPWETFNRDALQILATKFNARLVLKSYDWNNNNYCRAQIATHDFYRIAKKELVMDDGPIAPPEYEKDDCPQAIIDQYEAQREQWIKDKEAEIPAILDDLQKEVIKEYETELKYRRLMERSR